MAPLADAVGLVDGEQAELAAVKQRIQQCQKTGRGQALRRSIKQADVAAQHALLDLVGLVTAQGGVEKGGRNAGLVQGTHLVVHQGNQGRDHDGDTMASMLPRDRRNLVTQAFATPGGHQHQRIMPGYHVLDDGLLGTAELVVTEYFAKNLQG